MFSRFKKNEGPAAAPRPAGAPNRAPADAPPQQPSVTPRPGGNVMRKAAPQQNAASAQVIAADKERKR